MSFGVPGELMCYNIYENVTKKLSFSWFQVSPGKWWIPGENEKTLFGSRFDEFHDPEFASLLDAFLLDSITTDIPYWVNFNLEGSSDSFRRSLTIDQRRKLLFMAVMAMIFAPRIHTNKYKDWLCQIDLPASRNVEWKCRCVFCAVQSRAYMTQKNDVWKKDAWKIVDKTISTWLLSRPPPLQLSRPSLPLPVPTHTQTTSMLPPPPPPPLLPMPKSCPTSLSSSSSSSSSSSLLLCTCFFCKGNAKLCK